MKTLKSRSMVMHDRLGCEGTALAWKVRPHLLSPLTNDRRSHPGSKKIKLNGLVSQNCMVGNERHHSGGLKINFDHPGFFNTHPKHGTQSFFNSTPTGMQPPWAGIEPTNSCSAAECHSHLATGPRKKNY